MSGNGIRKRINDIKMPESGEHSKCDVHSCGKDTKYAIAYDYIYDGDRQSVLCCTWSWLCGKHLRVLTETLKKASKEFMIFEIEITKERVEFT